MSVDIRNGTNWSTFRVGQGAASLRIRVVL